MEEKLEECFLKIVETLEKQLIDENGFVVSWSEESLAALWNMAKHLELKAVKEKIEKMMGEEPRLEKGYYRTFCYNED